MAKFKIKNYRHKDEESFKKYGSEELGKLVQTLSTGLNGNLTFDDQFNSFVTEVTIAAETDGKIRNQLDVAPSEFQIVDITGGEAGKIMRATTAWSDDYLYLYNANETSVTFKVRFFGTQEKPLDPPSSNPVNTRKQFLLATGSSATIPDTTTGYEKIPLTSSIAPGGVSVSSNDITITQAGYYILVINIANLEGSSASIGTNASVKVVKNTGPSDLYAYSACFTIDTESGGALKEDSSLITVVNLSDASSTYSLQWVTASSTITVSVNNYRVLLLFWSLA